MLPLLRSPLIALCLLAACAAPAPTAPSGTRNAAYTGPGFQRFLVVGLGPNRLSDHRGYENQMVAKLIDAGVEAVPGWQVLPANAAPNAQSIRAAVARSKADAILLTRLSSPDVTRVDALKSTALTPDDKGDYYVDARPDAGMHDNWYKVERVTVGIQTATLFTTVFDVASATPVWSFSLDGYPPAQVEAQLPAYNAQLIHNLLKDRMLRP